MTLEVSRPAPDFTLKSQHGEDISLADFRGDKNVLLVFYPFAFSSVCTSELADLRDHLTDLTEHDAAVLAISCDHMFSLRAYAERDRYEFPLLSDFKKDYSRKLGVLDENNGVARRYTFVIDEKGILRHIDAAQAALDPTTAIGACALIKKGK